MPSAERTAFVVLMRSAEQSKKMPDGFVEPKQRLTNKVIEFLREKGCMCMA